MLSLLLLLAAADSVTLFPDKKPTDKRLGPVRNLNDKDIDKLIADGKMKSPFDYAGYVYPKVLNAIDPKLVTIRKPLN